MTAPHERCPPELGLWPWRDSRASALLAGPWDSLAAQEQPVHPKPADHQHDEGDGEAEEEPGAKVDHLCGWILAVGGGTRPGIRKGGLPWWCWWAP